NTGVAGSYLYAYQDGQVVGPTLTSVSDGNPQDPDSVPIGSSGFTLDVTGSGFVDGQSVVYWDSQALPTTFVSSGELTAQVSPAVFASDASHITTFSSVVTHNIRVETDVPN